jgi:hypothetical protein
VVTCRCSDFCGNGNVEDGEDCDGNSPENECPAASCNAPGGADECQCDPYVCGDGTIDPGEDCDPGIAGNTAPANGCDSGPCRSTGDPLGACTCACAIVIPPPTPPNHDPNDGINRGVVFSVEPLATADTADGGETALQVTMVDLQHPDPQNILTAIPFNFTALDTRDNGVCSADSPRPGHHCDEDADCRVCITGNKIGYTCINDLDCLSGVVPGLCEPPPLGVCSNRQTCAEAVAGAQGGCARWVGPPQAFMNAVGVPQRKIWYGARLQCTPHYDVWLGGAQKIAVIGADLVPSSEYAVRAYSSACKGIEGSCDPGLISAPTTMRTRRSGDVFGPFNPPDQSGQPDGNDVAQVVKCFRAGNNADFYKPECMLQPNVPSMSLSISGTDIAITVDGFRAKRFQYTGPCTCPSVLPTCAACAANGTCGAGTCQSKCISGPAAKVGLACEANLDCGKCTASNSNPSRFGWPCAVNAECGTDGVCDPGVCSGGTNGRCVDACGRCGP